MHIGLSLSVASIQIIGAFPSTFAKTWSVMTVVFSTLSKKVSLSHLKGTSFVSLIVFIRFNFEMWIYRVPQKFSIHRGKLTLCKLSEMSFYIAFNNAFDKRRTY